MTPRVIGLDLAAPAPTGRWWTVTLDPGLPLLNANRRIHHHRRADITRALREAGEKAARDDGVPALHRAHIYGIYCPRDRRRRDVGNLYPTFKAAIDGLVDAGVLPDDDDTHLIGPDMRLGPVIKHGQLQLVVIELYPTEPAPEREIV
jgi:hypothetical protein